MNHLIFFHIDKMNAQNTRATKELYYNLESEEWKDVYWNFLRDDINNEYVYKLKHSWGAYYIYVHYWYVDGEKNPSEITICNVKVNDNKVQIKRICTLCSSEYVNYIMEESKILIHEDFDKHQDYLKLIENEEIYNRLDIFAMSHKLVNENRCEERQFPLNEDGMPLHDINSISFSKAFRRMQDKAQIFTSAKGDHYRTRLTHTNDVARISKLIARRINMGLKNIKSDFCVDEDEVEATALGHDIGHTPFGHQGERTLNDIIKGKYGIIANGGKELMQDMGGFKHNVQSIRVLTHLEDESLQYEGLNISYRVLEGILKHSKYSKNDIVKLVGDEIAKHLNLNVIVDRNMYGGGKEIDEFASLKYENTYLSGKIVNIADEIAQRGSDIEDAIKSQKIKIKEIVKIFEITKFRDKMDEMENILKEKAGVSKYDKRNVYLYLFKDKIISWLIDDITCSKNVEGINAENDDYNLWFSEDIKRLNCIIEEIISNKVVMSQEVTRFDNDAKNIIIKLFKAYYENPRILNDNIIHRIFIDMLNNEFTCHHAVDFRNMDKNYVNNVIEEINNIDMNVFETIKSITKEEETDIITNMSYELKQKHKGDNEKFDKLMLKIRYEQQKIIIRNICDYIAGMTDSFALEEYSKIK